MEKIFKKLVELKNNSYSPYSKFRVSSIVILKDGTEFNGVNIENASYPATVCAERSAMFSVYSNGYKKEDIKELHLLTDSKGYGTPCGICRQVMSELLDLQTKIYIWKDDGQVLIKTVTELLPFEFGMENL